MRRKAKLLDVVRERIRAKHYSYRTEQSYVGWIRRFIRFSHGRHPRDLNGADVEAFLSHLVVERKVAASTQNQALSALLFLYKQVLATDLPWLDGVTRARRPARVPVVLTPEEVWRMLHHLNGSYLLMGQLLYGSGLRLSELLRLRVKDVDFGYAQIIVRDGKGAKDRSTMLAEIVHGPLEAYLCSLREGQSILM